MNSSKTSPPTSRRASVRRVGARNSASSTYRPPIRKQPLTQEENDHDQQEKDHYEHHYHHGDGDDYSDDDTDHDADDHADRIANAMPIMMMTNIPLHMLTEWQGNVRKTQNQGGIEELAASIKAHGLLKNLVVRKDGKKYAVVAGARRLKALHLLVKEGHIKANHPVHCHVTEADDPREISLAENVMREDMHPADQFEAFRALADKGMPVTDIAARFGKTEKHVLKLLRLASRQPEDHQDVSQGRDQP